MYDTPKPTNVIIILSLEAYHPAQVSGIDSIVTLLFVLLFTFSICFFIFFYSDIVYISDVRMNGRVKFITNSTYHMFVWVKFSTFINNFYSLFF